MTSLLFSNPFGTPNLRRPPVFEAGLNAFSTLRRRTGSVAEKTRDRDFVFAGQKLGKSLSGMALEMVLHRMKIENVTVHGFRSTFRDWAAECTNFTNEVCEAALAHVIGNKAEAAYRRGDLFEKRRKLMEAWAAYCTTPKTGKIVAFRL
jgi:integrase